MAHYLSSVVVALSPRIVQEISPMKSVVISLDFVSGSTVSQAVRYICRHPLVKGLLSNYYIVGFTFKYSEV